MIHVHESLRSHRTESLLEVLCLLIGKGQGVQREIGNEIVVTVVIVRVRVCFRVFVFLSVCRFDPGGRGREHNTVNM